MIGDKIKNRRLELGWTQEDLSRRMGYKHCSSINKIELGINDIPQSKIEKFAEVLGVSISYLLGLDKINNLEQNLIADFRSLNDEGQEKLADYAALLVRSGQYKKHSELDMVGEA